MEQSDKTLSAIVPMDDPGAVFTEVCNIGSMMFEGFDATFLETVFLDACRLFQGEFTGYKACNTGYHDFHHTSDTMLATARLLHGAQARGESLSMRGFELCVASALMHDTGYIQTTDDMEGTGGKYTKIHESRSIRFMEGYFPRLGVTPKEISICRDAIHCTGLATNPSDIAFESLESKLLARVLGTADLIGQMADRIYLEKLLFLFREFREANITFFRTERELLEKTQGFYQLAVDRCEIDLGGVCRYMRDHFRIRWSIDRDLYQEYIDRNMGYLEQVLEHRQNGYRSMLKRGRILEALNKLEERQ